MTPSVRGRATIHDKDILIYCISQLMAALNAGRQMARQLAIKAHDLLVATNRETSGDGYAGCARPSSGWRGPGSPPTWSTGETELTRGFGLIEAWEIGATAARGPDDLGQGDAVGLALPRGAGANRC